jgi:hypothetical protein
MKFYIMSSRNENLKYIFFDFHLCYLYKIDPEVRIFISFVLSHRTIYSKRNKFTFTLTKAFLIMF